MNNLDAYDWSSLTQMVKRLFGHWKISALEQARLLGFTSAEDKKFSVFFSQGVFTQNLEIEQRVKILLDIHRSLRLLFPNNRQIVYSWVCRNNTGRFYCSQRPLDLMLMNLDGLKSVQADLRRKIYDYIPS